MTRVTGKQGASHDEQARRAHEALDPYDVGVLIVDDSTIVQERLRVVLENLEGVRVLGLAGCAPEGLDEIGRKSPDLITLDLRMPGGDGFQLLEAMQGRDSVPEVVVLTNHASAQARRRCFELGAAAFFDKSGDFAGLERHIEALRTRKRGRGLRAALAGD